MRLFSKEFDKVQAALSEGMSVFADAADGAGTISVVPKLDKANEFLKGWNLLLHISEEDVSDNDKNKDILAISPVVLFWTNDTSMDSMFAVTVIFLSLAKPRTIDISE